MQICVALRFPVTRKGEPPSSIIWVPVRPCAAQESLMTKAQSQFFANASTKNVSASDKDTRYGKRIGRRSCLFGNSLVKNSSL